MKLMFLGIVSLCVLIPVGASGTRDRTAAATKPRAITVGAASSLSDALDEAIALWAVSHPSVRVSVTYGSSGTIQRQIEQGAPIDVFISAAPKQVDALERASLVVSGTRRVLFENELVLVAPAGKPGISTWKDLAGEGISRVALGEIGSVPAGQYAVETLSSLGILAAVKAKAAYAKDVREALAYVASGDADAGIVYASDAKGSARVRWVATAPAGSHSPIVYPGCVIAASESRDAAKDFLDWLSSSEATRIFAKRGFTARTR